MEKVNKKKQKSRKILHYKYQKATSKNKSFNIKIQQTKQKRNFFKRQNSKQTSSKTKTKINAKIKRK